MYSIYEYVKRLIKFMGIETNILISAMMNLDKFLLKNPNLIINKFNCYKIFFASLLETNKLYDDYSIPDKILYKIGLLKTNELIILESQFLKTVDYSLFTSDKDFFKYKINLDKLYELQIAIYDEKENNKIFEENKNNKIICNRNNDELQFSKINTDENTKGNNDIFRY